MDSKSDMLSHNNHLGEKGTPLKMVVKSESLCSSMTPIQHESSTNRVSSVSGNLEPCDQCDNVSLVSDSKVREQSTITSGLYGKGENKQKDRFTKYHSEKDNTGDGENEIGRLETRSDLEMEEKEDIQEGEKGKESRDDDNDNDNDNGNDNDNDNDNDKNWNTDEKESTDDDDDDDNNNNKSGGILDDKSVNNTQIEETTMREEQFTPLETIVLSEPEQGTSKSLLAKIQSTSNAYLRGKLMRE